MLGIMKISSCLVIGLLLIFSCNTPKKEKEATLTIKPTKSKNASILGNWKLYDLAGNLNTNTGDKLLNEAQSKEAVQQGLMLSFYPDGNFTAIEGNNFYENGKWTFVNDKKHIYISSKTKNDTCLIKYDRVREEELLTVTNLRNKNSYKFSRYAGLINEKEFDTNPYHSQNNTWRIKPSKSETPVQLQDRLGNYMKHLAYILKSASDNKLPAVSFEFSKGIIKIYNGGIGIVGEDEMPESWVGSYYSPKQAQTTYKMFEAYLKKSSTYKGATSGEWYVDDYNILTSIYGDLKAGKFPLDIK